MNTSLGLILLAKTSRIAAIAVGIEPQAGSVPALTWERARNIHLDPSFHPLISGHLIPSRSTGAHRDHRRVSSWSAAGPITGSLPCRLRTARPCRAGRSIVWILGAEGDDRLHGYRGDTGDPLFDGGGSGDAMTGLRHFEDLIAAGNRLYVGADGRLCAFAF
jgi:hypothetical protein